MQYGICLLSVVPCRKEPDNASEMVTQLLFGENYTVIEITENWLKVLTAFDNYECWINIKQHNRISESNFNLLQKDIPVYSSELIQVICNKVSSANFPITIGARLPFYNKNKISFDNFIFGFDGQTSNGSEKKSASKIISTAYLFINAPYLWGGKSPLEIDCS